MANYYSDHPEIGFYLNHPLMARIVELKEKGFADAKEYDYAPVDLSDAIENYKQAPDLADSTIVKLGSTTQGLGTRQSSFKNWFTRVPRKLTESR